MPALSPQRGETVPDGLCGASREAVPPPQHCDMFHGSRAVRCLSEAVPLGMGMPYYGSLLQSGEGVR